MVFTVNTDNKSVSIGTNDNPTEKEKKIIELLKKNYDSQGYSFVYYNLLENNYANYTINSTLSSGYVITGASNLTGTTVTLQDITDISTYTFVQSHT